MKTLFYILIACCTTNVALCQDCKTLTTSNRINRIICKSDSVILFHNGFYNSEGYKFYRALVSENGKHQLLYAEHRKRTRIKELEIPHNVADSVYSYFVETGFWNLNQDTLLFDEFKIPTEYGDTILASGTPVCGQSFKYFKFQNGMVVEKYAISPEFIQKNKQLYNSERAVFIRCNDMFIDFLNAYGMW